MSHDDGREPASEQSRRTSFAKGLSLLTALASHGSMRADTLAQQTGLPISSVYRYARDLLAVGFLEVEDGVYRPGERLAQIARVNAWTEQLSRYSLPVLSGLVETTGETAMVTVRVGHSALVLERVESAHHIRPLFQRGALMPLYAGASAKVVLAYAGQRVIDDVLAGPMPRLTPMTPDASRLRHQLARTRATGYVASSGETVPFAAAVSVPVRCGDAVVGGMSVAGRAERMTPKRIDDVLTALRAGAAQMQATLEATSGLSYTDSISVHPASASPTMRRSAS